MWHNHECKRVIVNDFEIQTDKMAMANQPDIVVVNKQQKKVAVTEVAIPSNINIKKKEHKKFEALRNMWKVYYQ